MPNAPTLKEQTRKAFTETANIYRKGLNAIIENPWPLIIGIAVIVLVWLVI